MNDWQCHPLWLQKEPEGIFENIDPAELVPEFTERLNAWDKKYQDTFNNADPSNSGFKTTEEIDAFEQEGIVIWHDMQLLFMGKYKIIYYSQNDQKCLEYFVDKIEVQAVFEKYDYRILPNVIEFLAEFGNLAMTFENPKTHIPDTLTFDFTKACETEAAETLLQDFEPRTGSKLAPIGMAYRDIYVVMMDEHGAVFASYDTFLIKLGNSIGEAIGGIVSGVEPIEVTN